MNIVLISGRRETGAHPSVVYAGELATELVGAGHRVRWLCSLCEGQVAPSAPDGVELEVCATSVLPFRSVLNRTCDLELEKVMTRMLREEPADVVDCLAYGGVSCVNLPWIAERLGAASVVRIDLAETLCHRGTLVDWTGAPCTVVDDAERCTRCSLTAFPEGLGGLSAGFGRALRCFGDVSPWPNAVAFEGRLDLVVGNLMSVARVVAASESDRDVLTAVGVPKRSLVVVADPRIEDLVALYESCAADSPA